MAGRPTRVSESGGLMMCGASCFYKGAGVGMGSEFTAW